MPRLNSDNPINWEHPLNAGLISHWQSIPDSAFYGGTRIRDLAAGKATGNVGTLSGGAMHSPIASPGGYGSLFFDGVNDYAAWGVPPVMPQTITAWWFVPASTPTNSVVLCQAADAWNSSAFDWGFEINGTSLYCYSNANSGIVTPTLTAYKGTWLHLCLVRKDSGGGSRVYFNGTRVASGAANGTPGGTRAVRTLSSSPWSVGYLDEIELRSIVYSAEMVRQLYAESLAGSPETLNWVESRTYSFPGASGGGGGGFQAAWARGSNVVIQAGGRCA